MTSAHEDSQKDLIVTGKLLLYDWLSFADTEKRAPAEPKDNT